MFTFCACAIEIKNMADDHLPDIETCEDDTCVVDSPSSCKTYSRRVKSEVWEFFVKKDKSALCKICNKEYAYHRGTSNLRDHLTRAHPSKLKSPPNQSSLDPYLSHSKCSETRAKRITEHIVDMVVRDLRPAALVEGAGFKALMNYIEPGYRVPTATHIAEVVRQKFINGKDSMKQYLESELHFMAITTDIWTSRANDAYLSLTMHFVDSSWDMISCVLATAPFPEHHTTVNIVDKVKQVVEKYNIEINRLLAVVHDQCSNMQLAGEMLCELSENCQSLSCSAHRLQLCVEEGLAISSIAQAIGAAKKLVAHFRHSALATSELRKRQEAMSIAPKKLQQHCVTRWNSTLYMIQSLLHNRWPLTAVLADDTVIRRQYQYLELSSANWLILEDVSKVLQHLEVATVFLSAENNVSISAVLPIVHGLVTKLAIEEEDSSCIKQFKTQVSNALKRRWGLDELDAGQIPLLVTAVDPRFHNLKFVNEKLKSEVKLELLRLAISIFESTQSDREARPSCKKAKTAFDILLGEEEESTDNCCEAELNKYFAEKVATRDTDPLQWWNMNEFRFKTLAQVARSILCVPATSTASERLFSTAGLTVTNLRSCLKPDNVDAFVF